MKLLIVANGFPPTAYGGVEVYTHDLATQLLEDDHQILIFCRESDFSLNDYTMRIDEVDGIRVVRVVNDFKTINSFGDTFTDPKIDKYFAKMLYDFQPEIIHFNHLIALSANLPTIASEQGIPSLITLHDYWNFCHRVHLLNWRHERCPGPIQGGNCFRCVVKPEKRKIWIKNIRKLGKRILPFRIRRGMRSHLISDPGRIIALNAHPEDFNVRINLFRENLSKCKRIITPSSYVRDLYYANGFEALDIEVISLGVHKPVVALSPSLNSSVIRIGCIGALIPSKGIHVLVEAFRQVKAENLRLKIYGRQDPDPKYANKIQRIANADSRINLEGPFMPDARNQVYERIDLLVIPSLVHETFSLVAREAISSRIPVVASKVGALPEVVIPGENGFLVPAGDVSALSSILRKIAEKQEILDQFSFKSSDSIESVNKHIDKLIEIYVEVIQECGV